MRVVRLLAARSTLFVSVAVVMGVSLFGQSTSAGAAATKSTTTYPTVVAPAVQLAAATTTLPTSRPRFWRETVRYGARDTGPYQISHVYEVQIRLKRVGVYSGPITGYFGSLTRAAVKKFQQAQKLVQNGVVGSGTWNRLIRASTSRSSGWRALPAVCRSAGWHTCYSRPTHELFTLYSGTLWNAWLVRGGAAGLATVRGTYRVYWQDIDHKSAAFHNAPMPYSQFFYGGEAIHGSGTMVNPLVGHSHGCINQYIEDAAELWRLTAGKRHIVTIYGAWA